MERCSFSLDPVTADVPGGLDGAWSCPHEPHDGADRCVFHLPPARRSELGVKAGDVVDRLLEVVRADDPGRKRILGADLPAIELAYERVEGRTRHPLDLRLADVDALVLDRATVDQPIELQGATVGDLSLNNATLLESLHLDGAEITGEVDAFECVFDDDAGFADATFVASVDFSEAEFDDDVSFEGVAFREEATFAGAEFHGRSNVRNDNTSFAGARFHADADFEGARFEYTSFAGVTVDGDATFQDSSFDGDATFQAATFEGLADFDEARFLADGSFVATEYHGPADFRGVEFHGGANTLEDDADFERSVFHDDARFGHAEFTYADFEGVAFESEADFEEVTFAEDVTFDDATFEGLADFDEGRFREDSTFRRTEYYGPADFRGAVFEGGANVLEDDADFEESVFHDDARFASVEFAHADFQGVVFEGGADFQETSFDDDVDFSGATFEELADFDEARFYADGDFGAATFETEADFRGVEFLGEARHLEDNARFEDTTFRGRADFESGVFTTANFEGTQFGDAVDFRNVEFRERLSVSAESVDGEAFVNMTNATLPDGTIDQPADHWVHYDMTRATVGSLELSGDDGTHRLFEYFRFVETKFDGFDFSEHRTYLERNDWVLHTFDDEGIDYDLSVEATPEAVETTYLYAYNNAVAMGDSDPAMEFAIHQAKFRRSKNVQYARDTDLATRYRLGKVGDVVGNYLWHLSCGYGYRLWRILATSAAVILVWGVLYALPIPGTDTGAPGVPSFGELFTWDGAVALGQGVYYSMITFTTVGYGDINPKGPLAQFLAATEGTLGVLLAALVIFVLGRRVAL